MNLTTPTSRQPSRSPWTHDRLAIERVIALSFAIEKSSLVSYTSAVRCYLHFCSAHGFPTTPTPETLSFFVVYMCHHIKPSSVQAYLSGVCNQLEPFFPDIRSQRSHPLVTKTLHGCRKLRAVSTTRKRPLVRSDLALLSDIYADLICHDDLLFLAIVHTGFHALLRLGELTFPDKTALRDYCKVTLRHTVDLFPYYVSFLLPGHKADRFFEGNRVILRTLPDDDDPIRPFVSYLLSRDSLFPLLPELWLRADGSVPTRSWFINRLRRHFPSDIAGHSLCSGGATALAESSASLAHIQAIGCWSSSTFQVYIRQHPALLAAQLAFRAPTS